jgi:hypothetical protein
MTANQVHDEASLGTLFGQLTHDLTTLLRQEVELAKVETKEEMKEAGKGAGFVAGAGAVGYLALLMLSFALAWWLQEAMHVAVAFLLVGVLHIVVAALLFLAGKNHLASVDPVPRQTVETLKEDVQWVRAQRS